MFNLRNIVGIFEFQYFIVFFSITLSRKSCYSFVSKCSSKVLKYNGVQYCSMLREHTDHVKNDNV